MVKRILRRREGFVKDKKEFKTFKLYVNFSVYGYFRFSRDYR